MTVSYSFHIHKGDHVGDLHVHVYFNEGKSRKLLGKYRLPSLEPLPGSTRELNNTETQLPKNWLAEERQLRKLQDCLRSTVFNLHQIAQHAMSHADIINEGGETYINIRIPVARRLGS